MSIILGGLYNHSRRMSSVLRFSYHPLGTEEQGNFPSRASICGTMYREPKEQWETLLCNGNSRNPPTIYNIVESFWPQDWTLVVNGLSACVLALCASNPDTEICGVGGRGQQT